MCRHIYKARPSLQSKMGRQDFCHKVLCTGSNQNGAKREWPGESLLQYPAGTQEKENISEVKALQAQWTCVEGYTHHALSPLSRKVVLAFPAKTSIIQLTSVPYLFCLQKVGLTELRSLKTETESRKTLIIKKENHKLRFMRPTMSVTF